MTESCVERRIGAVCAAARLVTRRRTAGRSFSSSASATALARLGLGPAGERTDTGVDAVAVGAEDELAIELRKGHAVAVNGRPQVPEGIRGEEVRSVVVAVVAVVVVVLLVLVLAMSRKGNWADGR